MPTGIKQHIRFPKDLFKIVTNIYNTFHMSDPQVFYNKEDLWTFPTETYDSDTGITMEPYYMFVQNPKSVLGKLRKICSSELFFRLADHKSAKFSDTKLRPKFGVLGV